MKTSTFLITLCLLLFSSCKKDDESLHMKLSIADNYLYDGQQGWAILSDMNGNVLTCQSFQNGDKLDLQNEVPYSGGDFHLTVVKRSLQIYYDCCDTDMEDFSFETFAFIKKNNLSLIRQERKNYDYPKISIDLNIDNGVLEKYRVVSTWAVYEGEEWHNPQNIAMKRDTDNVYLLMKMVGEQNWRHAFLKGVVNGTTINLSTSEMESVPLSTAEVPSDYESNLTILGIEDCNKKELFPTYLWYEKGENGDIPALYTEGIFDRYRSMVILKKDDEEFQFLQLGAPIDSYFPSPLGFSVENKSIQNFKLNYNSTPTVFEANWFYEYHVIDAYTDLFRSVNWKVWSDFSQGFIPPVLPTCITDEADWIKLDKLRLYSVVERKYSSIANYSDYIDFYLQNPLNPAGCYENNFNTAGTLEVKTKIFH